MPQERGSNRREPGDDDFMSASDLARIGYCERKVALDARYGRRTTVHQRAARRGGDQAHARFFAESQRIAATSATKGRCFIATQLHGPAAPETLALRAFRDLYLRQHEAGRRFVAFYYLASPSICVWLERSPRSASVLRSATGVLARFAAYAVERRLQGAWQRAQRKLTAAPRR